MNIIVLFALLCIGIVLSQQVALNRYTGTKTEDQLVYALPININKQTYKFRVDLKQEKSWVKSNNCKACISLECKDSCANKFGPAKEGVKCQQSYCTQSNDEYNQNNIEGKQAQIELNIGKQFNKNKTIVLADKIKFNADNFTRQYDGVINLFEEPELFEKFVLFSKDKKMYIQINDELNENYIDSLDQPFNETFQTDGSIEIKGLHIGNQNISVDNKGYIDINTKSLLLPEQQFDILKQKITTLNSECQLQSGLLKCSKSSEMNKIKDSIVGISFGDHKLEIPFTVFVESCKSKECQLLIKQSHDEKIVLGQVIFVAFGIHVHTDDKLVTFYRLKNSFSNKYHDLVKTRAIATEESRSFFGYIGSFLMFFFKIIVVLALISICINLYYNKARVSHWISNKTRREDSHYSPAFTEDIENAGVLQGYDAKNASKEFWQQNTIDGI